MNTSPHTMGKPGLFSFGDLNGFLGLLADNLANFSLLTGILLSFSFPSDIIFKNIYPATVMIIVVGNLLMTFVAKVVSQKNNLNAYVGWGRPPEKLVILLWQRMLHLQSCKSPSTGCRRKYKGRTRGFKHAGSISAGCGGIAKHD